MKVICMIPSCHLLLRELPGDGVSHGFCRKHELVYYMVQGFPMEPAEAHELAEILFKASEDHEDELEDEDDGPRYEPDWMLLEKEARHGLI